MVGTTAQSHVYVQYPPLSFEPPGAAAVMYDDGNKAIILPSQDKITTYSVGQVALGTSVVKQGPVLSVRFSLDAKILAVQRSKNEVELINRSSGKEWRQGCRRGGENSILGFFWTDCPVCDFVVVTSSGLELYALLRGRDGLRLVNFKKWVTNWYVYTHESRLVILASGMQCESLLAFQFSAGELIRLPKFEVTLGSTDSNRKPVLRASDVKITTMYGRIYCIVIDQAAMELHMFRFYRDAVVPQNSLPIFFPNVEISVIDNALVVHQIDAKVVLVYDVLSGSMQPVGLPLPLTIRGLPVLRTTRGLHEGEDINADASTSGQGSHGYTEDCQEAIESGVDGRGSGQQMCKMNDTLQSVREVYGPGWVFLTPDLIIDRNAGLLWRLHLDLEAFAATCSDACALISFLQRRKADPSKAKLLSLVVMRSMIVERSPLPWIASAMDIFTVTFHSLQRVSGKLSSAPAHPGSRTPGKGTPPAFTSNLQTTPGTYSTPQSSPRQIAPAASARPDVRIDGRHGFRKSPNIGGEPAISPHFMGVNRTPPSGSQHADGSCATSRNERVARTGVSSPEDWVSVDQEDHEQEQEQDQFAHGVFLGSMEMPATESSREAEGAAGESGRAEDCGLVRGKEKLTEGVVQLEHEGGGGNMWQLSTMIAQDSIQCELGGAIYTGEIVPDETDSDRIVRGAVTTRRAVHQVQNSGQVQESSSSSEWKVLMSLSPAVSPEEMTSVMFAIEEELVVDSSFLVAIALEYLRSAAAVGLRVPRRLHLWIAHLFQKEEKFHVLQQYINNRVLEPSIALALQILGTDGLEVDSSRSHPVLRKLGLEMLRHLNAHKEYIKGLLRHGELLQALRYMRKHQVEGLPPGIFLDMAAAGGDPRMLAAALRFFLELGPNFEASSDFAIYSKLLHEQTSPSRRILSSTAPLRSPLFPSSVTA